MKKNSRQHLKETLKNNPSCYVLITCSQPSDDGEMQVELSYEGDAVLASYLIQGAQSYVDDSQEFCDFNPEPKIRLVK